MLWRKWVNVRSNACRRFDSSILHQSNRWDAYREIVVRFLFWRHKRFISSCFSSKIVKCLIVSYCQRNHFLTNRIFLWCQHKTAGIDLLHKSHNAPVSYCTMHHFVTVSKWCIMGFCPMRYGIFEIFLRLVNCTLPTWPETRPSEATFVYIFCGFYDGSMSALMVTSETSFVWYSLFWQCNQL